MGGSSRSSGSAVWEGHAELQQALEGLATAKGTSANRVKAVANAAFHYAKDYKRVVHDIEIFLWKADVEHRLAALYAMDAIMRQSQAKLGAKDPFVKRFSLHMNNTVSAVKKIPPESQDSVRHVIEEWQSRGYYTPEQIEEAGGHAYSIRNGKPSSSSRGSPTKGDAASKEKLASLLSIIKKQKEMKENTDMPPQQIDPAPSRLPQPLLPTPERRDDRRPASPDLRARYNSPPSSTRARGRSSSRDDSSGRYDRRAASPRSPPRGRSRRDSDDRGDWSDPRDSKRPRGSRWGPPRSGDANDRNPVPDAARGGPSDRYSRHGDRSPRNRYDTAPTGYGTNPSPPSYRMPPPPNYAGSSQGGVLGGQPSRGSDRRSPPRERRSDRDRSPPRRYDGGDDGRRMMSETRDSRYNQGIPGDSYSGARSSASGMQGTRSYDDQLSARPSSGSGANGDKPPSSSGEVCRKFLAGRCTFGDRCWHMHDQQATSRGPRHDSDSSRRDQPTSYQRDDMAADARSRSRDVDGDMRSSRWSARKDNAALPPAVHTQSHVNNDGSGSLSGSMGVATNGVSSSMPYQSSYSMYGHAGTGDNRSGLASSAPPAAFPPSSASPGRSTQSPMRATGYSAAPGVPGGNAVPVMPAAPVPPAAEPVQVSRPRAESAEDDDGGAAGPEFTLQYDDED
ncbi:hypothetical protein PINS_up002155 [Pythium insidiosum]|nr:hypothetical protein PINS_up002155 [Pythium insidiosum]